VIGELRGRERPEEVVVVGGHLDSWDVGQGAQDDGGGCVISMEALRLLRDLGLRPRRTLRCVLWTNEENGVEGGDAGGGADIEPLMKLGVPGVEHRTTMANYFDWHHTHADMMDKVDPVELRKNVAAMAVMAYVLAEMPGTLADRTAVPAQAPGAAAGTGAGARSSRVTNQ
jgi:Zn-dependent M28 family amino/carboxypeptidase